MSDTLALKAKLYPLFAMSDHGVFSDRCTHVLNNISTAQFNPISFYAEGLVLDTCKRPSEICPFKDFYNIVPNTKQTVLGYPLTLHVTSSLQK